MDFLKVTRSLIMVCQAGSTLPILLNALPVTSCIQSRGFAARRGTRAKMAKKKVKVEVKKVGFIPHNLREKDETKGPLVSRRFRDFKQPPIDDVWVQRFFRWKVYDPEEAINCFREAHHPEIYNQPEASIRAYIELDMTGVKKNKYVESFSKIASIPHPFDHAEDRSVLVFCKTPELRNEAELAGASLVGDVEVVKKVERGDIVLPDFKFIVAHPNILPELVSLRGLLKRKFPQIKNGTLGANIGELVKTIRSGIQYLALRDEKELDYGFVDVSFGKLNMSNKELLGNLKALLDSIQTARPKRDGPFITRALLLSPPSTERLKIDLVPLIGEDSVDIGSDSDSEDEQPAKAKAV